MSIGSFLKGVAAQVNPWDNGATYGTYNPPASTSVAPDYTATDPESQFTFTPSKVADLVAARGGIYTPPTTTTGQNLLTPYSPPPVYAPKLDIAAVHANARSQAEGAVNPYYSKLLTDFLGDQATALKQRQAAADMANQNYQDQLDETLKANQTTQDRAIQDTNTAQTNLNTAEDQYQTDSGTAADANRLELARGATTGGLGSQALETADTNMNTREKRQQQKFQQQRDQYQLTKDRTLEDILTSNEGATKAAEKGKKAVKFDLDNFIENQGIDERNKRNALEEARQSEIDTKAASYASEAYANYINSIADPAKRLAGAQMYGGLF